MRILHVFDHSLPLQSGYVTRSLGIIRSQRARGFETIHVTTPKHPSSGQSQEIVDGLTFYRTPRPRVKAPVVRELLEMNATRKTLRAVIRKERPDILHAHSPVLNAFPALSVGGQFNLPVVYEVRAFWEDAAVDHGTTEEDSIRYRTSRFLETRAMHRADRVVALCEPLRQDIVGRGVSENHVSIVPNAVDDTFLKMANGRDDAIRTQLGVKGRTVVGFIGSFYSYEGLDLLLEAAAHLRTSLPEIKFLLIGGGPDEARLRRIAGELGLEETVRFVGRVKLDEVARYYDAIDIFVYPRRRMRLTELVTPLKPLEAMAQHKAIIASDVGGHRELMRDGETGYLFPAGSPEALVTRLQTVIANPADRVRVAANGRRFVENERSWKVVVDRYATIYDQILFGRPQASKTANPPRQGGSST